MDVILTGNTDDGSHEVFIKDHVAEEFRLAGVPQLTEVQEAALEEAINTWGDTELSAAFTRLAERARDYRGGISFNEVRDFVELLGSF